MALITSRWYPNIDYPQHDGPNHLAMAAQGGGGGGPLNDAMTRSTDSVTSTDSTNSNSSSGKGCRRRSYRPSLRQSLSVALFVVKPPPFCRSSLRQSHRLSVALSCGKATAFPLLFLAVEAPHFCRSFCCKATAFPLFVLQ